MKVDLESDRLGIVGEDIFDNQCLARAGGHEQNCVICVLYNRVVHLAVIWERELDQTISESLIDSRLQ